ncbi:MAG: SigB/SigF/SigG family RNA polymerase sigma factor [Clostridia bacterium]|nr:SigB/SigF/SigG family RNA polymerase sigma factor [Clostridia bacterium]
MQEHSNCKTYQLIHLVQDGDTSALDKLVTDNIKLVYSIAHKFNGRGIELEDLVQIGSIGLVKAIKKFDLSYDVKFSTYAVPMIMGEMKRFLRDDGPVKVSRSLKTLAAKAFAVKTRLSEELGKEPTISEIAAELGETPADLATALDAARTPESLYTPYGDDESLLLIDKINGGLENEGATVNKIALSELIAKLPEREKKIIILRYFKDKTQTQIAKQLGISQVQVSRLEKKILNTMRESLSAG